MNEIWIRSPRIIVNKELHEPLIPNSRDGKSRICGRFSAFLEAYQLRSSNSISCLALCGTHLSHHLSRALPKVTFEFTTELRGALIPHLVSRDVSFHAFLNY